MFICYCCCWGGKLCNVMQRDKEKAEVLNAFFASVFKSKTSCPQVTQPPDLEDRNWAE